MPGVVVLESMWNKKGRLLDDEPSVLPYLKAIRQSLAWEGIRVNLVYRRFYSSYDLGLLLEEVRRRRRSFQVCYIASHGQRRKLVGIGDKVIRLETLVDHCRPSRGTGYIFGACDFVTPDTARNFLLSTGARFVAGYQKAIPWTESMLVDCLFLSYLLGGTMKWVRTKHGSTAISPSPTTSRSRASPSIAARGASRRWRTRSTSSAATWTAPGAWCATSDRAGERTESMSAGEAPIKQAVKWIDEQLEDDPKADRTRLIDEAGRRFDLTPLDSEFLLRHLSQRKP
jgi:hypothetical protein